MCNTGGRLPVRDHHVSVSCCQKQEPPGTFCRIFQSLYILLFPARVYPRLCWVHSSASWGDQEVKYTEIHRKWSPFHIHKLHNIHNIHTKHNIHKTQSPFQCYRNAGRGSELWPMGAASTPQHVWQCCRSVLACIWLPDSGTWYLVSSIWYPASTPQHV